MKKIIVILFALLVLAGCSKTIVCDECHQTKKGKTYTIEVLGQSIKEDICDDCYQAVKLATELVGGSIR